MFSLLFLSAGLTAASGKDAVLQLHIERAARIVAAAYESGNPNEDLFEGKIDALQSRPKDIIDDGVETIITMEHSLSEKEEAPVKIMGFSQYAEWLENVRANYVSRSTLKSRPLGACAHNCCEFPFTYGISHNHLYLKQVCFVIKNDLPYLSSILLYDGD